jgi:hypothetical protein
MMTKRRLIGTSDGVLLWLASVVTLGAGYYLTFGVLGNAIDRQHQRTAAISATMLANTQVLAQRPALELQAAAIAARLRRLNYGADTATSVARFIHAAVQVGAAQHVDVTGVDARSGAAAAGTTVVVHVARTAGTPYSIESIPLDVTLRGAYRPLLATIRGLARTSIPMRIEVASIDRDDATAPESADRQLTARIHVVLERLADDAARTAPAQPNYEETTHARFL